MDEEQKANGTTGYDEDDFPSQDHDIYILNTYEH